MDIQNLSKRFEGLLAVDEVSFSIVQGTITGIFGDNGAGKTTLFNLISGFDKPDDGKILYNGKDITHESVITRSKIGIGRLFQTPRVFNDVSVLDNLLAAGNNNVAQYLHNYVFRATLIKKNKIENTKRANYILDLFNLVEKDASKAYEISVGEKKLLSLGSLLMNGTKFLMLDEPFAGISEVAIPQLISIFYSLKDRGITILMIEHDQQRLNQIADTIYEMKHGKLNPIKIVNHVAN